MQPCLWVYRQAVPTPITTSDQYAIRTRNLQEWNLTRYRCANRSKAWRKRGHRRGTTGRACSACAVRGDEIDVSRETLASRASALCATMNQIARLYATETISQPASDLLGLAC